MTYLRYTTETEEVFERTETDAAVIAELVRKGWVEVDPPELPPAPKPDSPAWKVKVWMVRNGIDLATIPAIIASQIPAGPQQTEALLRWEQAPTVPFSHPLVALVAGGLSLDPADVWDEILAV